MLAQSANLLTTLPRSSHTLARLIGDIGGTNARFGWQIDAGAEVVQRATYACADFPTLSVAIAHYLSVHSLPGPAAFALGIATPVTGDRVSMTNHHWSFSISALREQLGANTGVVINDFVALACAIPTLTANDVIAHGHVEKTRNAPIALIGPGTGLGVATLFADSYGRYQANAGEGGHVTLAATSELEATLIHVLRDKFGHVSAERAISGPGLVSLYDALCQVKNVEAKPFSPADITAHAVAKTDSLCVEAVAVFTSFLGNVAGNLALTVGAFGGVYIGGGIVPRLGNQFDVATFRKSFESKGRFASYLARIPSFVITCEEPALYGAAYYLDQHIVRSTK